MYDTIRRVTAAVCVTATLIQPALASAQSFALEPSDPRSSTPGLGDWKSSIRLSPNSLGTMQPRPQLRPPRTPPRTQHSKAYRGAQRATAAFALGLVGFFVGSLTAYSVALSCNCGGSETWYIGGALGTAGGVAGALLLTQ
jgi:hypothetical protein